MQIVEIGDCSMVIMKDSRDPYWTSVGDYYRRAMDIHGKIVVAKADNNPNYTITQASDDCVYSGGRLILFFKKDINRFALHDRVSLYIR